MQKLTINRLGPVRNKSGVSQKTGKPYSFNEVGFQTNEYGDRWFSFSFNGATPPIVVGQSYEMEVTERNYNGKNGPAVAYSARFPKKQEGGVTEVQFLELKRMLNTILTEVKLIRGQGKSWAPTVADADFTPQDEPGAEDYEDEEYQ